MANKQFDAAKREKNDEFYTQLVDIERELSHYKNQFRNKIIFCNCDNPYESNFFKYFAMHFNDLGLKKLITTCYKNSPIANKQLSLFDFESLENKTTSVPHKIIVEEVKDENKDGRVDLIDVKLILKNRKNALTRLKGDGDFRSDECIELLKEADIVVTNPPFSLFREYVAQLMEYKKKFLIIGNINALTYKEIFPLIKENKIWFGKNTSVSKMEFRIPDYYPILTKNYRIDPLSGDRFIRANGIRWFTNLEVSKRHENLTLYKKYNPEEYPKYDNYDAIEVSKVAEIPYDYEGAMGVPITFIDKYNPEQFEIIALGIVGSIEFTSNKKMEILKDGEPTGKFTKNAKGTLYYKYNRNIDKKPPAFKDVETGELYSSIYARIIIRRIGEAY